ncbi:alpha/beta hydrolase [Arthrobacter sp. efr-133-TYG-118]|uniref:alpha/beta fold hydrolase n=1 Tax=Arthrobacter sp. efr-133-TYG-118 TaxID=3040279 RepID=UPI002550AC8C|nr:alpha/beta hydrolase [Arthrobacter sp. efr-133-TYG-118]
MPQELTESETSRTVQTKDWKIHYNEAGEGSVVLFLHGSGPGATGWSNFAPNLVSLAGKYRVIAADLPGWGKSDPETPADRNHVEAVLQLLDALKIERAAIVGNSMGGHTGLCFAMAYPDRVSHLVTMGVPLGLGPLLFTPRGGLSEGLKVLVKAYRDPSPETMRELVEIMTYDHTFATDELVTQRSSAARVRPDHLANYLSATPGSKARPVPLLDIAKIAEISAPTLIFHGRDDRVNHFENSLWLASAIPDARMVLINRCGHWLQLEHADEFNRIVADFVGSAGR